MQTFEIKNRYSGAVIYSGGGESLRGVVVVAVDNNVNLSEADLRGVDLRGADLYGANLSGVDLYGANLRWADLSEADLFGANLSGADLYGADLRGANLSGVDLYGANLRWADLSEADLFGANLSGADLYGANLRGVDLSGADLSGAKITDSATLTGDRPAMTVGPIGSRRDYLSAYMTTEGVLIRAGCFFGTLAEFVRAVEETHGDNMHGREYAAAIALIEAHADIWMPQEVEAK